jgi:hypothetical protein
MWLTTSMAKITFLLRLQEMGTADHELLRKVNKNICIALLNRLNCLSTSWRGTADLHEVGGGFDSWWQSILEAGNA